MVDNLKTEQLADAYRQRVTAGLQELTDTIKELTVAGVGFIPGSGAALVVNDLQEGRRWSAFFNSLTLGGAGILGTILTRGAKGIMFRFVDDAAQFIPLSQLQRLRELPKRELRVLEAALQKADTGADATKLYRGFIAKHGFDELVTNADKARGLLRTLLKPYRAASPVPRWIRTEAHHIVPVQMFDGRLGTKLHDLGIDLNGLDNGVLLPTKHYKNRRAALHKGKHLDEYNKIVRREFEKIDIYNLSGDEGRQEALVVLERLRDDLLNRRVILQSKDSLLP